MHRESGEGHIRIALLRPRIHMVSFACRNRELTQAARWLSEVLGVPLGSSGLAGGSESFYDATSFASYLRLARGSFHVSCWVKTQVLPDHLSKPGPYVGTADAGDSIELYMERDWLGSCLRCFVDGDQDRPLVCDSGSSPEGHPAPKTQPRRSPRDPLFVCFAAIFIRCLGRCALRVV